MASARKLIAKALDEDDTYLAVQKSIRRIKKEFREDKVREEAATIHASRASRKLHSIGLKPTAIFDAIAEDLRARARLVELQGAIHEYRRPMQRLVKELRGHIVARYGSKLKAMPGISGVSARAQAVDSFIADPLELLDTFDAMHDLLANYIKDIDQANYGLSNITTILKVKLGNRAVQV